MPRRPVIEFWYDFASTYSYLAAERIASVVDPEEVRVRWRPFLLGPIFAAQGLTTSPFVVNQTKGRHMWRDLEREAARQGLPPVRRPEPFPQNSLTAARVATHGQDEPWLEDFSRAVFRTAFVEGRPIADPAVMSSLLEGLGVNGPETIRAAGLEATKTRLRAVGEEARSRGIFGAPSFLTEDGELFWGNDRLEQAVAWALGQRPPGMA